MSEKTYIATDGTVFGTKKEWRKHEMLTQYTFCEKENETFAPKKPGDVDGQAFDIRDLVGCTAAVCDASDMVQIDACSECKIMIGASSESVFIRECSDCTFYVCAKQLRLRDCTNCTFSLYSQTEPVIETSSAITFTPFSGGFEGQERCMRSANLNPAINFWWGIFDFNDEAKTGKNFKVVNEPLEAWWPLGEATQVCVMTEPNSCPLPSSEGDGAGGGGPTQPGTGMQSFGIATGQAAAQEVVSKNTAVAEAAEVTLLKDDELPEPKWTPYRVGIRYDPPLLALEFKDEADVVLRKDIPFPEVEELAAVVAEVDDDMCAQAVLDNLLDKHRNFLNFEKYFSKRQVLRLIDMLLQGGPDTYEN